MLRKLLQYIDLRNEIEAFDDIHAVIQKDVIFKGTNLWILVFAIIIASVGLNINSTAVIIGAMLISPLMGPINGMGYSIATYDLILFKKALKNFGFAVFASLAASTLYFTITPVSTAHSELLARTSPTIYDVLIALFGGLAGIVAISSKQKGNVIPGVAIATALMPPLCTAGYGLATAQFTYFFGAFYLFTINTVFIGISSVIVSQFLRFPIRTLVDDARKNTVNRWLTVVIIATLLPSLYFGYVLVKNEKFTENAKKFTRSITVFEGSYLLRSDISARKKVIELVYGGNSLTDAQKKMIKEKSEEYSLEEAELIIEQGFSSGDSDKSEEILKGRISSLTHQVQDYQKKQDSMANIPLMGRQILSEISRIYPQINSCVFSQSIIYDDLQQCEEKIPLIVFGYNKNVPVDSLKTPITLWLQERLKDYNVKVYFEAR